MPLRILKRNSKQYNVVSKTSFVISVELLDNGVMECTLDADSTGRDCLQNVSQRLGLHQNLFFGFRYISRTFPRVRWIELDRPLRKQLEKYSQDSQLSLGVMFYVGDVNLLKDEMARYHYFLQLKSDVIDGKLNCSIDQAISLAAYSLQAEFGDFDPERHTFEYLKDFAILPKDLTSEQKLPQINVDALYEAVVRQYASLIGFPPPLAEIYYIMVAQQLDGYGEEPYPAKDDAGNEILICISSSGLIIRRRDWTHIAAFRWIDIKSLLGHKRLFVVESSQSHRTMQYHFADAEMAKYVRKLCTLQSTFYKEHIQPDSGPGSGQQQQAGVIDNPNHIQHPQQHLQQMMNMNRNVNLNSYGGGSGSYHPMNMGNHMEQVVEGSTYFGVPPDLLAPAMGSSNTSTGPSTSANPTYISSSSSINNNTSSSFNQSGFSLNSSSASGINVNVNQNGMGVVNVNRSHSQNYGNGGGGIFPSPPSIIHPFPPPHHLQQAGVEPIMFHHPGELYNQMQMMPTIRTNPLTAMSSEMNDPEYSNGYGRAVSDYTAALQQKYGSVIPDLSARKSSSQLYFSSGTGGDRSRSQSQALQQIRASLEEEPIYQNEIVSQMHSMELQDSASKLNSASDVTDSRGQASSSVAANAMTSDGSSTLDEKSSPNSRWDKNGKRINQNKSTFEHPYSSSNIQQLQSQPLTTTHPPIQLLDESPPVYVFKPPPPYPGLGSNYNSAGSLQNQSSNSENSSVSNSITSLSKSGALSSSALSPSLTRFEQGEGEDVSITLAPSQLSPSANSSIVSAQVHCEPVEKSHHEAEEEKVKVELEEGKSVKVEVKDKYIDRKPVAENGASTPKKENNGLSSTNIAATSPISIISSTQMDNSTASSGSTTETEISSANSSAISTSVDELDSPKVSTSISVSASCSEGAGASPNSEKLLQSKLTEERFLAAHHKPINKAGQLFGKPIDPAVLREFQGIPKTKNNPSFATALKRENSRRNRSPEILPYEDNSVRLNPTRQNPSGYINASPLSVKLGDRSWLYVVAQLPLPGNGPALWQMIWESEIKVLVSLERDSSALFYPQQKGASLTFNDFQVVESKAERRNSSNALTIAREFNLIHTPKKKQRKVWVMPYEEEWKDDVPVHTEHFLCFLEEVNSIQRKVSDPSSPLAILCGTGAGRSGIFILSDLLLHAADCGHKLRCDALLKELRMQRMSLVTSASQYAFVLHTLAKYLAQSRLI